MLQNALMFTPAPVGVPDKWEQDKQTALSLAQIMLEDAVAIGREAVIVCYGLTEQQAALEGQQEPDLQSIRQQLQRKPEVPAKKPPARKEPQR